MRVLLAGSHGLIGTELARRLQDRGDEVVRLVRMRRPQDGEIKWSPDLGRLAVEDAEGFDAVVNLAGSNIGDRRWTNRQKVRIWNSRSNTTELLVQTFGELIRPPRVFVCASAVGFYGSRGEEILSEDSEPGAGFLSLVCRNWEDATTPATEAGIRVVNLRTGLVLSEKGGIFAKMLPLFRVGAGGRFGKGSHYMPWVSLDDEVRAILFCLDNEEMRGPVNVCNPQAVTNWEFTYEMGRVLRRPTFLPIPKWMVSLPLGKQVANEVLFASQRAIPKRLTDAGFTFNDTDLNETLQKIVQESDRDADERIAKHKIIGRYADNAPPRLSRKEKKANKKQNKKRAKGKVK